MGTNDVFTLDYHLMRGFMAKTNKPHSFLNAAPLAKLLQRELGDDQLVGTQLKNGHLKGLAVTASNYSTGEATTFFESSIESLYWHDHRRDSIRTRIGVPHLLASAALPLLFPPQRIGNEYFVDGSLRMSEPLRPVIKMGADRIIVIGVRNETLPLGDEG
ncbi:MAG: patatin-like phospholipase family protein, partial [Nitrosomonas sp.]|nr:patatin-like phospholipase family protein [Nitrosomonas sp.]